MVVQEVFGKIVNIDIPADVFPTKKEIEEIEAVAPNCQHGWYQSVNKHDNGEPVDLHYRYWLPEGNKPKGILIFTHGIHSHSGHGSRIDGRPLDIALLVDTFTSLGLAVYAADMYGHGFSEGTRFYIPDWIGMRDDAINFCKLVADKNPKDIPLFLSGESIGGCITILMSRYFQDHPGEAPTNFDSSLLLCPAIEGDVPGFPVYQILRYVLAPMRPKWRPFFMPNTISPDRIWADEKVCAEYSKPRSQEMQIDACGIPFRLGTAVNMLMALEEVRNNCIPGFDKPFCIVHGDKDVGVPISGSKLLFGGCATPENEKEFHTIQGAHHGIIADPKAEEAIGYLSKFVQARMEAFTPPK
ncbi:serine aminopeptidase, S33 [Nitzschia inconspicua]|uniref:Serine aminopeptidase, S33 n=1 Tax=Nitzschia inconspicua TaxID=303405 RepID=A0A9K3PJR7_9STRA|nr:serine aminopeptidase, S33 [Nitzschia inconspicua]